jgi:hypothetical protein
MKVCISVTGSIISTETNKDKDTIHVFLQRLNAGFVVTLSFFPVKIPEGVSTSMKIAYHARFLTRIIGNRATFGRVVNRCLLPLW